MIDKCVNPITALKAHSASYAGLWLIHSNIYPEGALLTSEAYRLYKRMAGPSELQSHTATYITVIEPEHFELEFVGSLEVRATFKPLNT